jgi:hypothetical protein
MLFIRWQVKALKLECNRSGKHLDKSKLCFCVPKSRSFQTKVPGTLNPNCYNIRL